MLTFILKSAIQKAAKVKEGMKTQSGALRSWLHPNKRHNVSYWGAWEIFGKVSKDLRYDLEISWHSPLDTLLWRVERKEEFVGWILSIICLSLFRVYLFRRLAGKDRTSMNPAGLDLGAGVAEAA